MEILDSVVTDSGMVHGITAITDSGMVHGITIVTDAVEEFGLMNIGIVDDTVLDLDVMDIVVAVLPLELEVMDVGVVNAEVIDILSTIKARFVVAGLGVIDIDTSNILSAPNVGCVTITEA